MAIDYILVHAYMCSAHHMQAITCVMHGWCVYACMCIQDACKINV